MHCEHCISTVGEELRGVPGVTAVDVDLASGLVTITSGAAATGRRWPPRWTRPATSWP